MTKLLSYGPLVPSTIVLAGIPSGNPFEQRKDRQRAPLLQALAMGKRIDEIAELPASARYAFLRAMMLRYPVAAWFASDSELLDWAVKTAGLPRDASARLRRVARLAHLVYYKPFFLGIKWTLAALALAAGVLIFNAPL